MKENPRFVCGQLGRRDHYQLPIALAEMGRLEKFYTDFFSRTKWQRWLIESAVLPRNRASSELDPDRVRNLWSALLLQRIAGYLIRDKEMSNHLADWWLAWNLGRLAQRGECHILTYEPYAVPRPAGGFSHARRQIVFHFHPHVDWEDAIYAKDQREFPDFYRELKITNSPFRRRTVNAWRQADLILCASSFTRDSLVAAGMPKEMCRVIPYGVKAPTAGNRVSRQGPLKLLFVGRNPLRKGLHHLLLAWREAKKRDGDRLTIVCAAPERAVRELASGQADVVWRESVSEEELTRLYRESDALVVPSLCEGFGHVYLEAMGHGCAVVGTAHSALPDLGGESEGVFLIPAGAPEKLTELIGKASADPGIFRSRLEAARKRVADFTWEKFREGVKVAVREVTG
jgi:glycosyltransferase involved in cell wall biosynthesis